MDRPGRSPNGPNSSPGQTSRRKLPFHIKTQNIHPGFSFYGRKIEPFFSFSAKYNKSPAKGIIT
ncbi:MAG: hypothetical protein D6785_11970 [Planctomycetota bacterium]|nr:MAG: hypothetical protein D6785_11970 [Planctomycetota bacterium]